MSRPGARGRGRLLVVGAAVVLLAAVCAVLALQLHDRDRLAAVQRSDGPALTAARGAAHVLFSYDGTKLQADLDAALPLTAQPYTDVYRDASRNVVWPAARADRSVVDAAVRQAVPTSATTADRLVALVLLDRTTRRAGVADATTEHVQLRMTLVRRDGGWLVSRVESL